MADNNSNIQEMMDIFAKKLRVSVIFGGDKNKEGAVINRTLNPRSWKSYEKVAQEIFDTLKGLGFKNVFLMPDDLSLVNNIVKNRIQFAWLNTGGVQGYNPVSHTPSIMEMMGIPYIGHNPLHASMLDNKHLLKYWLRIHNISTPNFITWHYRLGLLSKGEEIFRSVFDSYEGPFVVKPVSGRASIDVHFVENLSQIASVVDDVSRRTRNEVLVENYLEGPEYCVAVYGYIFHNHRGFTKQKDPFTFSQVERLLDTTAGEKIFTSMDKKAITGSRLRMLDNENDMEIKNEIDKIAGNMFYKLGLRSAIRLDIRADTDGKMYVLEANPKPDLKKPEDGVTSIVAMGIGKHDMTYEDLILSIIADRLYHLYTYERELFPHIFI